MTRSLSRVRAEIADLPPEDAVEVLLDRLADLLPSEDAIAVEQDRYGLTERQAELVAYLRRHPGPVPSERLALALYGVEGEMRRPLGSLKNRTNRQLERNGHRLRVVLQRRIGLHLMEATNANHTRSDARR